jgi:TATA-box binding protein (TBP) (component of TFIID and TFIIIB)
MDEVYSNKQCVNISTITLICNLNKDKINISYFVENFDKDGVTMKRSKSNKDFEVSKRGKIKKTFFNQVSLNYEDISKKSIKIFSNGKLQITGLSCYWECNHVMNMVLKWMNEIFVEDNIVITHSYVGMINSNFCVRETLNLQKLNAILNRYDNVMSIYNPESYPAINMKIHYTEKEYKNSKSTISIFIFGTGNIVITGAKSIDDITLAYRFIMNTLNENRDVKRGDSPVKKTKNIDKFVDGYPIRQYLSALNQD